jgi:hypothetical protein
MARIKSSTGRRYAANNYYISRTQCGAVVSPNQDFIWVGDDALDYDTLNPQFSKPCAGLLGFGGDIQLPHSTALVSNKATALAPHNSGLSEGAANYHEWLEFNNTSFTHNLDKGSRIDKGGTVFSFQDSGGNAHHLIVSTRGASNDNGSTYYTLLQGDDFSNPVNSIKGTLGTVAHSLYSSAYYRQYAPIAVDATNKVIYAYSFALRTSYGATGTYGLCEIPFTTVPVDGSLTLGTPSDILFDYDGNGRYLNSHPVFYAGQNNAGADCFMMFTENEYDYWNTSASSNRLPSTAVKTNKHRIHFYKYDPATTTVTTIADLKGTEGFVGDVNQTTDVASDHFSFYVPTHFEQSPIAGETDVYYAFSPCFNATTADMSLLLHTWDKAADTFATEVASFSFSGADVIQDFITYQQHDNLNNMNTQLNCVLTKDGSSYYVTVFYSHFAPDVLAVNSASTLQTAVTFSIDATDFSALTYHSHTTMTVLGWAAQDTNNTRLFIIEPSAATLWTFSASGWSKSVSEGGVCRAISQDIDARYWAVMQNTGDFDDLSNDPNVIIGTSKLANFTLSLLSADLPASVSVVFDDATITYAGSNLTKNLTVNAYDENGDRVAKTVKLKLTGSNAVFQSNNGTTLTTTTSAAADTSVPLTISGAGFVNVSASFTI